MRVITTNDWIRLSRARCRTPNHSDGARTFRRNHSLLHSENFFGIFVTQAFSDPTKTVPYVLQGGLGLPDRDYYVSTDPAMVKLRGDYTPYVAKILTLAGLPNAQARAQKIVALETKIAQAHETLETTEDVTKADNPWTRADFDKKAPGVDWGRLLGAAQLGSQNDFVIWQPAAIAKMAALVGSQPLEVWKDWLIWDGHRWREDEVQRIHLMAQEMMLKLVESLRAQNPRGPVAVLI